MLPGIVVLADFTPGASTLRPAHEEELRRLIAEEHLATRGWIAGALQEIHPLIGDIRCPGLDIGIELVSDRVTKEPVVHEAGQVYLRAQELGVMLGTTKYAGLGNVLKINPPLNVPLERWSSSTRRSTSSAVPLGDVEAAAGLR